MEKDSQKFQSSEARKKLDCYRTFEIVAWSGDGEHLKPEAQYDLRKSLAWDSAFFTSPGVLDPDELFETLNFFKEDNTVDACANGGNKMSLASLSLEPERTSRISECNSRRSLAWDSAFFTNPGVLDHEELSLLNSGFNKTESRILSEAKKELWKSTDSSSTVKSSRFSVASIEIDLFEDLRASLHKPVSKESEVSARRMSKPLLPSGRQKTNLFGKEKIHKESSLTLQTQRVTSTGDSKPVSHQKPPKVLRGANTSSVEGANRNFLPKQFVTRSRMRNMSMHKRSCLREKPGYTPIWKLPSSCSALSPASASRRKADSRLTASDSAFKTPSRYANGRDERSVRSSQPRSLLSTPKSSHASPASSNDGWSSDSTTSLSQKSCTSTANPEMKTCRAVLFDSEGSSKLTSVPDGILKDIKPSGLRMPFPKIGFFDAEKCHEDNSRHRFCPDNEAASKKAFKNTKMVSRDQNDKISEQICRKSSKGKDKGNQGQLKGKKCSKITDKNAPRAKKPSSRQSNGLVCKDNKENICCFDIQVNGLSRDIEAIDLNGELVVELKAEKGLPF